MHNRIGFNRLERKPAHKKALIRNMMTSLFRYERVETTHTKALEVRRFAEKMITRGKIDSVHNRRQASRFLYDKDVVNKLLTDIGPRFNERKGGYTRVLKLGKRFGDSAEKAILELVTKKDSTIN